MIDQNKKHVLFVYGSLKVGHQNHHYLKDSPFLGLHATDKKYTMISLGSIPGVIEKGSSRIIGELYYVDDSVLHQIDILEGHPTFYKRVPILTSYGESYMYILEDIDIEDYEVIKDGNWIKNQ